MQEEKFVSVLLVDQQVDHKGILANAAFVLGLTAGRELSPDTFGADVVDGDGNVHRYLTRIGHFVRKAGQNKLRTVRAALSKEPRVTIVDYTEDAAPSDYSLYASALGSRAGEEIQYRAVHVYGPDSIVTPLTKNLSRLE